MNKQDSAETKAQFYYNSYTICTAEFTLVLITKSISVENINGGVFPGRNNGVEYAKTGRYKASENSASSISYKMFGQNDNSKSKIVTTFIFTKRQHH